ncbi:MAG: hypothetical protein ACLP9C_07685 [Acidimicrobiales bacterium]
MVACADCRLEARPGDRFCRRCGAALGAGGPEGTPTASVPVTAVRRGPPDDATSVVPVAPHPEGPGPQVAPRRGRRPAPDSPVHPTVMVRPKRAGRGLVVTACVLVALLAAGVGLLASGALHRSNAGSSTSKPPGTPPVTHPTARRASPGGSSTTSSTTTATTAPGELTQAQAIGAIATQSGSARSSVQNAVADIGSCGPTMAADVTALQNDAATRQQLASQLGGLAVGAVPNGTAIVAALTQALDASAAADTAYAAWGRDAMGCTGSAPADANETTAAAADSQATTAKQNFVDAWAPLAQSLGLPAIGADQI